MISNMYTVFVQLTTYRLSISYNCSNSICGFSVHYSRFLFGYRYRVYVLIYGVFLALVIPCAWFVFVVVHVVGVCVFCFHSRYVWYVLRQRKREWDRLSIDLHKTHKKHMSIFHYYKILNSIHITTVLGTVSVNGSVECVRVFDLMND